MFNNEPINLSLVELSFSGPFDYPDFCDTTIDYAAYGGRDMTEEEIEYLYSHHDGFIYDEIWNQVF